MSSVHFFKYFMEHAKCGAQVFRAMGTAADPKVSEGNRISVPGCMSVDSHPQSRRGRSLCADGVGERLRGDRHADPPVGEQR